MTIDRTNAPHIVVLTDGNGAPHSAWLDRAPAANFKGSHPQLNFEFCPAVADLGALITRTTGRCRWEITTNADSGIPTDVDGGTISTGCGTTNTYYAPSGFRAIRQLYDESNYCPYCGKLYDRPPRPVSANWGLTANCPKCNELVDFLKTPDFFDGRPLRPGETNTANSRAVEVSCPNCRHDFTVNCY